MILIFSVLLFIAFGFFAFFPNPPFLNTIKNIRHLIILGFYFFSFLIPFSVYKTKRIKKLLDSYVNLRYVAAFYLVAWVTSIVGVTTWQLQLEESVIIAGSIGAFIPALYYIYQEIVKRPSIKVSNLRFEDMKIAPLYLYRHIARPAVFVGLRVENIGNATAEDCAIKITLKKNNSSETVEYYARWANPGNDERYDLLPSETQRIHLFKIFLTTDFFAVKEWGGNNRVFQEIKDSLGDSTKIGNLIGKNLKPPGNPSGKLRLKQLSGISRESLEKEDIRNQFSVYHPARKPPEMEEKSVRGGWMGQKLYGPSEYTIYIEPIAENYRKPAEIVEIEGESLDLSLNAMAKYITEGNIKWQEQWQEKGYQSFKDSVNDILQNILEENED